jgi:hypothetical protein
MRQGEAIFANFICTFGDSKVLIDYLEEIVIPALTEAQQVRVWKTTNYYLLNGDTAVLSINGSDRPVAYGRFIKDTILKRDQFLQRDLTLLSDPQVLQSSPSAIFVLFLDTHRLVYYAESAHAPDIKAFESTARSFLLQQWDRYLTSIRLAQNAPKQPRAALEKLHPRPRVKVIPISGEDSIREFIARYELITKLEVRILERNREIDASETAEGLRQLGDKLGSPEPKIIAANKSGLQSGEVANALEDMASQGNQEFKVTGKTPDGNPLVGNNEDFSLKASINEMPDTLLGKVIVLAKKFVTLVVGKVITAPESNEGVRALAVNALRNRP